MLEFRDASRFSLSLLEARDSTETSISMEVEGEDEEFYEKIEAPKFVDFTVPNHHCPDDRYWFCLRLGCDQKHEEEMDSETIYKNFLLRVMAARSPNVRLRKSLNRNASSSKCPQSAPPKSSKSRLAVMSSITQKNTEDKKKVVRALLKPVSTTPATTKKKPAPAKYLTTPRKRNSPKNQNSFRSVRNQKSMVIEVPKNRIVAKALVFHSPKKAIKVKTSVELQTPLTRLRERAKIVEITSQRKMGYSNKSLKTSHNQEAKSVASTKRKSKLQLSKHSKKELEENGSRNLGIDVKSRSGSPETETGKEQSMTQIELNDNDDKENTAVSDENRAHDNNHKLKGKILGLHYSCGKLNKGAQTKDKSSGIVAPPTTKSHKPKPTTPKPFRLRTDERGILKEANLERRNNTLAPQNDQINENHPQLHNQGKADRHQGSEKDAEKIQRSDSKKERSKTAAAITPQRLRHSKHQELKSRTSKIESKAMKRLENFRKLTLPQNHQQSQHQGLTSTRRKKISCTNPSQPLEVIYEASEQRKAGK